MTTTPVYTVCSVRPQVGKTLLSRLLCEFLQLKDGDVMAFDVNVKEPSLLDYLPKVTETADVTDTLGKMHLMDRVVINDGVPKVIDLGFHAFDEYFKMTEEIGFIKEATRRNVTPFVLFVPDTDRGSVRAHQMLCDQVPQANLIIVDNEYVVRGELPAAMSHGRTFHLPALPTFLKTYVDRLTFSFTGYLRQEPDSSTELHQWIRRAYLGFRELELGVILQQR